MICKSILNIVVDQKDVYFSGHKIIKTVGSGSFTTAYETLYQDKEQRALLITKYSPQEIKRMDIEEELNDIPHIVKKYEVFIKPQIKITGKLPNYLNYILHQDFIFQIVQYVPFQPLSQQTFEVLRLEEQLRKQILVFYKILKTVQRLHKLNIYHFDLKPDNILVSTDDFYIIDFGSAQKVLDKPVNLLDLGLSPNANVTSVFNVTPMFSSIKHDLVDGQIVCDKYDVYSLGCILFYLLTGKYPRVQPLQMPKQLRNIATKYGMLIVDLLIGMTCKDSVLRYDLYSCLHHPAFCQCFETQCCNVKSKSCLETLEIMQTQDQKFMCCILPQKLQKQLLTQFHFFYSMRKNKTLVQNGKKYLKRSQSQLKTEIVCSSKCMDDSSLLGFESNFVKKQQYVPFAKICKRMIASYYKEKHPLFNDKPGKNDEATRLYSLYGRKVQLTFWETVINQLLDQDDYIEKVNQMINYADEADDSFSEDSQLENIKLKQFKIKYVGSDEFSTSNASQINTQDFNYNVNLQDEDSTFHIQSVMPSMDEFSESV